MSSAPIISGIRKLPNAPARIGMITKKIITVACIVNEHRVELGRNLAPFGREQHAADDRHVGPRPGQLPANAQREQAADEEPQQRREQELQADDLVIEREDVGAQMKLPMRHARAVRVVMAHATGDGRTHRNSRTVQYAVLIGCAYCGGSSRDYAYASAFFDVRGGLLLVELGEPAFVTRCAIRRSGGPSSCSGPSRTARRRRCRTRRLRVALEPDGTASCRARRLA